MRMCPMGTDKGNTLRGKGTGEQEQMKKYDEEKRMEKLKERACVEVNESDRGLEGEEEKTTGGEEKDTHAAVEETQEPPVAVVDDDDDEEEEEQVEKAKDDADGREDRIKSLNHSTLYLGNLHLYVDDNVLREVFSQFNGISELKVIKDRATGMSAGYGFARFFDRESAGIALDCVQGQMLYGQPMKVNWALQKEKEDELGSHHHVFVGDLSADVTDQTLMEAFSHCQGCSDARVMWDFATGRTKGYGFVSFVTKEQAQSAIEKMDGAHLGSRCIRCGWAQHKTESALPPDPRILDRIDPTNTNIYIGNMPGDVSNNEAKGYFSEYGTVLEMKLHRKGNYGFVRYKTHHEAVNAIVGLSSGEAFNGRKLKCSWGRHPKVPPSGVKAQLMMAAVSQGSMVHTRPLAQQTYASQSGMMPHGFSQGTLFTTPHPSLHLDRDTTTGMMDPLVDSMSGMNLYGNQPLIVPPSRLQPHHVGDIMPTQYYGSGLPPYTTSLDPRVVEKRHGNSQETQSPEETETPYGFQT